MDAKVQRKTDMSKKISKKGKIKEKFLKICVYKFFFVILQRFFVLWYSAHTREHILYGDFGDDIVAQLLRRYASLSMRNRCPGRLQLLCR